MNLGQLEIRLLRIGNEQSIDDRFRQNLAHDMPQQRLDDDSQRSDRVVSVLVESEQQRRGGNLILTEILQQRLEEWDEE